MKYLVILLSFLNILFASTDSHAISLQLSWLHQFQSAGFYVALEKGFYKEAGLNVTLKEYARGIDIVDEVLTQQTTYGVGKSSLVVDRAHGKAVVALMALFQSTPSVLISTNPNIQMITDFKAKSIMITPNEANSVAIISMLLSHGIRLEDVTLIPHSCNVGDLVTQKIDAMASYISNEPFELNRQNVSYRIFDPKTYGFDFYGDILFTSEAQIRNHPKQVEAFYRASYRGWKWAFEHIGETADIIVKHYNTQHKTREALIYEGEVLRKLAFNASGEFGVFDRKKIDAIAHAYHVSGFIKQKPKLDTFIDPLHFSSKEVKIGVLANRGDALGMTSWETMSHYLNESLPRYHFIIVPLSFKELEESLEQKRVDFMITNPLSYVQLEHRYGISRIATLENIFDNQHYSHFGSVIVARANDSRIHSLKDVAQKRIGIVDKTSFGGYFMALKELSPFTTLKNALVLDTHDKVIQALLEDKIDVGIVRTDILERLRDEEIITLDMFKILGEKKHEGFALKISTDLYPEWAFARTPHTSEELSNQVLSMLITQPLPPSHESYFRWKAPLDYSKVHTLLKELKEYPYEPEPLHFKAIFEYYRIQILSILLLFMGIVITLGYIKRLNQQLMAKSIEIGHFNSKLEKEVTDRTYQLTLLNNKLEELANTDELTKITNRRHFYALAKKYFSSAKRNHTELFVFSLDIDFFKKVNDTYGHAIGDEILKLFCNTITSLIRESDIFGRLGGEEFALCVQSTSREGAITLAEKIRETVAHNTYKVDLQESISITVSIGLSSLREEDKEISDILKRSDEALYYAKNHGRNQVSIL